jgi:hypothetical protein
MSECRVSDRTKPGTQDPGVALTKPSSDKPGSPRNQLTERRTPMVFWILSAISVCEAAISAGATGGLAGAINGIALGVVIGPPMAASVCRAKKQPLSWPVLLLLLGNFIGGVWLGHLARAVGQLPPVVFFVVVPLLAIITVAGGLTTGAIISREPRSAIHGAIAGAVLGGTLGAFLFANEAINGGFPLVVILLTGFIGSLLFGFTGLALGAFAMATTRAMIRTIRRIRSRRRRSGYLATRKKRGLSPGLLDLTDFDSHRTFGRSGQFITLTLLRALHAGAREVAIESLARISRIRLVGEGIRETLVPISAQEIVDMLEPMVHWAGVGPNFKQWGCLEAAIGAEAFSIWFSVAKTVGGIEANFDMREGLVFSDLAGVFLKECLEVLGALADREERRLIKSLTPRMLEVGSMPDAGFEHSTRHRCSERRGCRSSPEFSLLRFVFESYMLGQSNLGVWLELDGVLVATGTVTDGLDSVVKLPVGEHICELGWWVVGETQPLLPQLGKTLRRWFTSWLPDDLCITRCGFSYRIEVEVPGNYVVRLGWRDFVNAGYRPCETREKKAAA